MRLDNKLHKWLKLFLKLVPFYFLIYNLVALIGSDVAPFFSINSSDDYTENIFNWNQSLYQLTFESLVNFNEFVSLPSFLYDFNDFMIGVLDIQGPNGAEPILYCLVVFEWFLIIDILDLILGAFRFIINLAHSWLDSFYEKSKRGGN